MRRPFIALTTAVAAALVLAGCAAGGGSASTSGDSTDATIAVGSLYEPQNLSNTQGGGQGITEAFNGNVYEGLFRLTDDGQVEPLLAEGSEVSDDGLTYTITLREGSPSTPARR